MHGGKDGGPNLIPLLDLVLQLIMFLMITANFVRIEQFDDSIQLPLVQQARPLELKGEAFVFLTMTRDGWLSGITDKPYIKKLVQEGKADKINPDSRAELLTFLQVKKQEIQYEANEKGKTAPRLGIVLRADADTRWSDIWAVMVVC